MTKAATKLAQSVQTIGYASTEALEAERRRQLAKGYAMTTPTTDLKQTVDKIGFEMILRHHPKIIEEIKAMFDQGVTAKQIERRLLRYSTSTTANLVVCAAHYLEAQQKTGGE